MTENEKWLKSLWERWRQAIAEKQWELALRLGEMIQAMERRTEK